LLEYITESGLNINLFFVFIRLKGGGKYIDIEKYIEDIPTTWIKRIFDEFTVVLDNPLFNEQSMRSIISPKWEGKFKNKKDKNKRNEIYLAALIRLFFPVDSPYVKFLGMISKILTGSQLPSGIFFKAFMMSIRPQIFNNWNQCKINTLKSLVLFSTMIKLNLIIDIENNFNTVSENSQNNELLVFEKILNSNAKKAVFLEGILAGKLLAIQYAIRASTPFLDKLHGLHISFSDAKRLLPHIINKLREYQISYKEIEMDTANEFLLSETSSKLPTDDESSYFFTLGMLLHSRLESDKAHIVFAKNNGLNI
jgi:CRISPR-associated protein Csh1